MFHDLVSLGHLKTKIKKNWDSFWCYRTNSINKISDEIIYFCLGFNNFVYKFQIKLLLYTIWGSRPKVQAIARDLFLIKYISYPFPNQSAPQFKIIIQNSFELPHVSHDVYILRLFKLISVCKKIVRVQQGKFLWIKTYNWQENYFQSRGNWSFWSRRIFLHTVCSIKYFSKINLYQ